MKIYQHFLKIYLQRTTYPQPPLCSVLTTERVLFYSFVVTEQPVDKNRYYPKCHCAPEHNGYICDKGGYVSPPFFQAVTSDILQDVTGDNEEEYFLDTTDMYRLSRLVYTVHCCRNFLALQNCHVCPFSGIRTQSLYPILNFLGNHHWV